MRIRHSIIGIGLAFFAFTAAFPAFAAEKLVFGQHLSKRQELLISGFLSQTAETPLEVARVDLNRDGIDEFIARKDCPDLAKLCDFVVLAEMEHDIAPLATIAARSLVLGDDYTAGVRNILVYRDTQNDFEHEVYVWEPGRSQYILSE